ncbi:hypothetical protein BDA96_02G393200 [Sorghum bicolor]|nr:hypothetical protein BDA96_02G393200 [Sorghum bicolor]
MVFDSQEARKPMEATNMVVSNHGASQLDYASTTLSVLYEMVKAVAWQCWWAAASGKAQTCSRH